MSIPDYVFTTEDDAVKVGVWDAEKQEWSDNDIEDLSRDMQKR